MEKNILLGTKWSPESLQTLGTRQNTGLKNGSSGAFDSLFKSMLSQPTTTELSKVPLTKTLPVSRVNTEAKVLKKAEVAEPKLTKQVDKPLKKETANTDKTNASEPDSTDDKFSENKDVVSKKVEKVEKKAADSENVEALKADPAEKHVEGTIETVKDVKDIMKDLQQLIQLIQESLKADGKSEDNDNAKTDLQVLSQVMEGLTKQFNKLMEQVNGLGSNMNQMKIQLDPKSTEMLKQFVEFEQTIKSTLEGLQKIMSSVSDKSDLKGFADKLNDILSKLQPELKKLQGQVNGETVQKTATSNVDTLVKEVQNPNATEVKSISPKEQKGQEHSNAQENKPSNSVLKSILVQDSGNKEQKFSQAAGSAYQDHTPIRFENSLISFSKQVLPNQENRIEMIRNIMDQVVSGVKTQLRQSGETTAMTMKLSPQHLGNVEVKLELVKGSVLAEFKVENQMVKGALESNLADLKNALSDKGYNVENLNIYVDKDGRQNGRQEHQQRDQRQDQDQKQNDSDETFTEAIKSLG